MIGNAVCEVIPYKTFKEKMRITRKYKKYDLEIYKDFILVVIKK